MNFFDEDDGDDVIVRDAYPDGERPCVGACLHQKLMGIIDEGIKESDTVVKNGQPCVGLCQHFRSLGMRYPTNRL